MNCFYRWIVVRGGGSVWERYESGCASVVVFVSLRVIEREIEK